MNRLPSVHAESEVASAIHLEYIQNLAAQPVENGVEAVEGYHRALFLHHHGKDLERYEQDRRVQEDRLVYLEARLESAQAGLVNRQAWIPVHTDGRTDLQPTPPWNGWDAAMFGAALAGIIGLLVFGILNISFNLLESGLVTFLDHPVRAYFWAALLPVGALAVKVGWDVLSGPRSSLLSMVLPGRRPGRRPCLGGGLRHGLSHFVQNDGGTSGVSPRL